MALQRKLIEIIQPVLETPPYNVPLFDTAPAGQQFPFAEIARLTFRTDRDMTADQQVAMLSIAVYSDKKGRYEVVDVMDAIYGVLHDVPFTFDGGYAPIVLHETSDAIIDSDGVTYVGTTIYSITIAPS